jgi:hypothetical protein
MAAAVLLLEVTHDGLDVTVLERGDVGSVALVGVGAPSGEGGEVENALEAEVFGSEALAELSEVEPLEVRCAQLVERVIEIEAVDEGDDASGCGHGSAAAKRRC